MLQVAQLRVPRAGGLEELGLLAAGREVVDALVKRVLVGLLGHKVPVLEAVGMAAQDVDPLVVVTILDRVGLRQRANCPVLAAFAGQSRSRLIDRIV